MTAMRSSFARFELPAAVLDGVLRASLRVDVRERAVEIMGMSYENKSDLSGMLGAAGSLKALRKMRPDPRPDAAFEHVEFTEEDKTKTNRGWLS